MKKKLMAVFAITLSIVFAFGLIGCGSSNEATSESEESSGTDYSYDVKADPPTTKKIVCISGTWEEMGQQYGEQAKDSVQRDLESGMSRAIELYGSHDKAVKGVEKYKAVLEEKMPELLDMYAGMAVGAEVDETDLIISEMDYNKAGEYCSTISAWGDMTKDGKLVSGINSDGSAYGSLYTPAVVAYPDKGNAFISYSGMLTNGIINEKGLVVTGTQGQEQLKDDVAVGLPTCSDVLYTGWKCDNAKEAKNSYIKGDWGPGHGENFICSDVSGDGYVIEHTASKDSVRSDKDYGLGDYIIATNGFLNKDMWDSLFQGDEFWDDDMPRYWTEEKIITDQKGDVNIDTIGDALGCNSYYVDADWYNDVWEKGEFVGYKEVKNGVWEEDVYDISDTYTGFWTPENREVGTKRVQSGIMDASKLDIYVMSGSRDTNISALPDGTGNFWRLNLGKNQKMNCLNAEVFAKKQIYLGARDIDRVENNGTVDKKRKSDLMTAKSALLQGQTYANKAGCTSDKNTKLMYMGKALTEYGKAQCYAQRAQDNPTKLIRDGEEYSVY